MIVSAQVVDLRQPPTFAAVEFFTPYCFFFVSEGEGAFFENGQLVSDEHRRGSGVMVPRVRRRVNRIESVNRIRQ